MSCGSLMFRHGLLLIAALFSGVPFLTSSTDCTCPPSQNARCLKQAGKCTLVCHEGYWGNTCEFGRIRLTGKKGYITDGDGNYTPMSKRMWLIDAKNRLNASIHFKIDELLTECNWDHLYIFDGDSIYSPQLAAFSGHFMVEANSSHGAIPQDIVAKSGQAYIYFYSDTGVEKAGFNISYSIVENCSCSSNGTCNAAGLCSCNPGWSGKMCEIKVASCPNCANGVCNATLGQCVCHDGFTGEDCSQLVNSSYWASINIGHSGDLVSPRASHGFAVIGDWMWVYGGYTSYHSKGRARQLFRYHLKEKIWEEIAKLDSYRWGHSMISYKNDLVVFGGEIGNKIETNLTIFNTESRKWNVLGNQKDAVAVTGHTATLVGDKMIVIFGLSTHGLYGKVQEYDFVKSSWKVTEPLQSFVTGRYGHTSVYDSSSRRIFVYGGRAVTESESDPKVSLTDSLIAYKPISGEWILLSESGFKLALHSATILDGMMLVFGGNPYDNQNQKDVKCHSSTLLSYDFACQQWKNTELPQPVRRLARYGHSAVAKGRTMYIFGGFNGALFNDVLTYTLGDCSRIFNETECLKKYFSAGCYWFDGRCVNKGNFSSLHKCPAQYRKQCNEYKSCQECASSPFNCGWTGTACQVGKRKNCSLKSRDSCSQYFNCNSCVLARCSWKGDKCRKAEDGKGSARCPSSCGDRTKSSTCLDNTMRCIWCENLKRCIDDRLYVLSYPYGQCLEWTRKTSNIKAVTCSSKKNCQDCYTLPGCGWCEGFQRNGVGQCLNGGYSGPAYPLSCDRQLWNFIGCPACQCNGHSNCSVNSSVCLACDEKTVGKTCDTCTHGYFGDPRNRGMCQPCNCNGHANTCDASTGKCNCRMKGATGDNCDRCYKAQFVGNATDGGSCYYVLQPNYRYGINVSDKTIFNFICSPDNSDQDTIITVDIIKKTSSYPAMLNISVGPVFGDELLLLSNVELISRYQEKFSKDMFAFGSNDFNFKIYIYDLTPFSSVTISVHQPGQNGINLLQFFIIFLACFIGLLLLAVIFWKAKASYDAFCLNRRRNVEMTYMTNRPFASVPVCIEQPEHVPMKVFKDMMVIT